MPFSTTEAFIVAAESQLGARLPHAFRTYLITSNGGEIDAANDRWLIHPVFDATDRKRAARSASHIVHETQQARSWRGFPPRGVAFASNGSDDHLVFMPDPQDTGQLGSAVFLWQHETASLTQVAEAFDELQCGVS